MVTTQEWRNRTVAEHACSKMGRAAARRNAPKQSRVIRVGPNEGAKKLGSRYHGFIRFFPHTGGLSNYFGLTGVLSCLFLNTGGLSDFLLNTKIPTKKWGDTEIAERGRSVLVMRARYRSAGLTPHQRGWTDAG